MPRLGKLKAGSATDREIPREEKRRILLAAFCESIQPIDILDLDEWSDLYRQLPRETSAEYGQWSTDRFPFLRKIMKALSPSSIAREIVAIKGSQLGFTEICLCFILYISKMNPGPAMYVQKTKEAAEDFSKQKLKPSIEACSAVTETLGDKKSKALSNTWDNKGFPGGYIVLGGANSGAFLRSKSIRDALADEEDSFEGNVDGEGSPIGMIAKRQQTFSDRKLFRLSTPKITETSTIEPAFERGSQERFYVPCPICEEKFIIYWESIKYSKELEPDSGLPVEVWCECPHCLGKIEEHKKTWMLGNGVWMSEKGSPGKPYIVGDVEFPSFHISSFYSPYGFFSWRDAVKEWFDYKMTNDVALLQVFINQTVGESFSLVGHDISYAHLQKRKEVYEAEVPMKGLVLTAGADIQADRIECEVVAWGMREESYSIDYAVFWGDTSDLGDANGMSRVGQPTVWRQLDEYLMRNWKHAAGHQAAVECTLIDSKYKTEETNIFCRQREHRRIFASHGTDGWGKGFYERPKKRHERYKTWRFRLFVDEIKSKIQSLLRVEEPGPGFCHFPKKDTYNEKHFKGLTAESIQVKHINGKKKLYWHLPSGARNEQTDCRAYAYAAKLIYPANYEDRARQLKLISDSPSGLPPLRPAPRRGSRRGHPGVS